MKVTRTKTTRARPILLLMETSVARPLNDGAGRVSGRPPRLAAKGHWHASRASTSVHRMTPGQPSGAQSIVRLQTGQSRGSKPDWSLRRRARTETREPSPPSSSACAQEGDRPISGHSALSRRGRNPASLSASSDLGLLPVSSLSPEEAMDPTPGGGADSMFVPVYRGTAVSGTGRASSSPVREDCNGGLGGV